MSLMCNRGRIVRTAFSIVVAAGALALHFTPAPAQQMREMTAARQHWGEETLKVDVRYSAGRLIVEPAADGMLYRIGLRYDEARYTPLTEYDRDRGRLVFDLKSRDREGRRENRANNGARARVALAPDVPLRLDLQFGAGEAKLQLGGMALRELELATGASKTELGFDSPNRVVAERIGMEAGAAELTVRGLGNARAQRIDFQGGVGSTTLDFGGQWVSDARVSVEMGIGELVLKLPRDLGVRIDKDSFLTSFDANGMVKRGNSWYNAAWDRAEHRVTIDIDAAIGEIRVEWLD